MMKELLYGELAEMEVEFTTAEEQLAEELGSGAGFFCRNSNCRVSIG